MITLKKMIDSPEFTVLTLVAGEEGLAREITGINITESVDLAEFYRPNELLVSTGINMEGDTDQLIHLVESAFHHEASGIVFNIGPYIPNIPKQVLHFAAENQFPVFQIPWTYRVADFLTTTVQFLSSHQHTQSKTEQLLSNILFHAEQNEEKIAHELAQLGYKKDAELGIIVCTVNNTKRPITKFTDAIESAFTHRYKHFLSIVYQNQIIYMVNRSNVQTPNIPFLKTVESIYTRVNKENSKTKLIIGMGNFYKHITNLSKSYHEALTVIHLSQQHQNPSLCKYRDIGAYKIIMGVQDRDIIETFHHDMLGRLYRYDKLHDTDFVHFLRVFLEEDGSTSHIGRREFIHRNTVLYKIKKIESLLDVDLSNSFTKTNISLAFMIEDILKE